MNDIFKNSRFVFAVYDAACRNGSDSFSSFYDPKEGQK